MEPTAIFSKIPFDSRIYIAGHNGLVGRALLRALTGAGFTNLVTREREHLDLVDQSAVRNFFDEVRPEYVFLAAAKVGGILYNSKFPADFLYENLMISTNVIHAAAKYDVEKLVYLGSSCIYPREAPQPIPESALMTGPLEPTNEGYAVAKIAGLKLCEKFRQQNGKNFVSVMPTNLYGPGDNFDPNRSHVIPGLMRRFHEAKEQSLPEVVVWGTGSPRREFLHVDDLARGLLVILDRYDELDLLNIGTGEDVTIKELALMMKEITGYSGEVRFDTSRPDGTPRKVLDVRRVKALDWAPVIPLEQGLRDTYQWALRMGAFTAKSNFLHPDSATARQ